MIDPNTIFKKGFRLPNLKNQKKENSVKLFSVFRSVKILKFDQIF